MSTAMSLLHIVNLHCIEALVPQKRHNVSSGSNPPNSLDNQRTRYRPPVLIPATTAKAQGPVGFAGSGHRAPTGGTGRGGYGSMGGQAVRNRCPLHHTYCTCSPEQNDQHCGTGLVAPAHTYCCQDGWTGTALESTGNCHMHCRFAGTWMWSWLKPSSSASPPPHRHFQPVQHTARHQFFQSYQTIYLVVLCSYVVKIIL